MKSSVSQQVDRDWIAKTYFWLAKTLITSWIVKFYAILWLANFQLLKTTGLKGQRTADAAKAKICATTNNANSWAKIKYSEDAKYNKG